MTEATLYRNTPLFRAPDTSRLTDGAQKASPSEGDVKSAGADELASDFQCAPVFQQISATVTDIERRVPADEKTSALFGELHADLAIAAINSARDRASLVVNQRLAGEWRGKYERLKARMTLALNTKD